MSAPSLTARDTTSGWPSVPPVPWLVHGPVTADSRRLRRWRDAGITTVLDTGRGLGADLGMVGLVHERPAPAVAGIDVVTGVGVATSAAAAGIASTERLLEHLLRTIDARMADPTGRTVFLTCSIDGSGLLVGVERTLRAVGTAHVLTGAPVLVRTCSRATTGLDVAYVLGEEGVDPRSVLLTGCGDTVDVDHLAELADAGYRLAIDRFGNGTPTPDQRVEVVAELCRRGHARSLVVAPDLDAGPDTGASTDVVPALGRTGIRPGHLAAMLCETPRRWLGR